MNKLAAWLITSSALGVLGTFLPWFEPRDPGTVGNIWHSWDNTIGLLPSLVALVAGAAGFALAAEASGRSTSDMRHIASLLDRLLWFPLLGIAACIWVWVRLPNDDIAQTCFGTIGCAGGSSSWINDRGATRGTQFGFWVSLASCVIALLAAITLYFMRDALAERMVERRYPGRSARAGHPPLQGGTRSAAGRQQAARAPQSCIAYPRHSGDSVSSEGHCQVCFPSPRLRSRNEPTSD